MRNPSRILSALLPIILLFLGCDRGDEMPLGPDLTESPLKAPLDANSRVFDGRDSLLTGPGGPVATKTTYSIVTDFLEIEDGDDVGRIGIVDPETLDPSTLLFESRAGNPILAADGDHVTWGDFSAAQGAIIVKCTEKGTHVVLHLTDLLPKGLYSIRNRLFEPGTRTLIGQLGYTETDEKGKSKGNISSIQASKTGEGRIRGIIRAGALAEIGACMLEDVDAAAYDWHTVAIYQMDGTPELDAAGTFVEQGAFQFNAEDSPPIVE